ncbi:hypothetical protein C0992_002762 [Termitomyces sp. T32_za158]|nr:hypothetical protein C0992_002762 [Termitomyces sp. T32_za158]
MPRSKFPTRAQQPTTSGLGKQFTSPIKRRDKAKTTTYVQYMGRKQEIAKLKAKIDTLKKAAEGIFDPPPPASLDNNLGVTEPSINAPISDDTPMSFDEDLLPGPECIAITQTQEDERVPRRIGPNQAAKDLYTNWTNLLARLVTPLLEYTSKAMGRIPDRVAPYLSLSTSTVQATGAGGN